MRKQIIDDYRERIQLSSIPTDLKNALKTHERVPRFVENLSKEIYGALEAGVPLTRFDIKNLVYNMTDLFIRCVMSNIEKKMISDAAIAMAQKEENFAKKFDDQGNADLTEEFGVKIVDGQRGTAN